MHMADAVHSRPFSFPFFVIGYDSRFAFLLIVLTAGVNIFLSGFDIFKGNYNIGMSQIFSLIPAEYLMSVLQADQALTPEQFVHSVIIEIQDRTQMAGTRAAVVIRDLDIPALFHPLAIALQIHVSVGSLCGNQNGLVVYIASGYEETVGM